MFVIQQNCVNEIFLRQIKEVVDKHKLPHIYIGMIPFSHEITSNEPLEGTEFLPYGSTSLTKEALKRCWRGNYWVPETFDTTVWNMYRNDMLNSSPAIKIKDAIVELSYLDQNEQVFTRPTEDLKSYSGMLTTVGELREWLKSAILADSSSHAQLTEDTEIIISEPHSIRGEWRWFVIDGKVIDGSLYRSYGQLKKLHETDSEVIAEAQKFADKWLPHNNCVMDLALAEDGMKVVEFNSLNSSGFYMHNIEKIFLELWRDFETGR